MSHILVKLTRGTGRGQWQSYQTSNTSPITVFFRCKFCGLLDNLGGTAITADGLVCMPFTCPQQQCLMTYQLFFEGWAHKEIRHPAVFDSMKANALCQADGAGE